VDFETEVRVGWKNLSSQDFIICIIHKILLEVIKSKRLSWTGHEECLGNFRKESCKEETT
jgi:hypothetical protein